MRVVNMGRIKGWRKIGEDVWQTADHIYSGSYYFGNGYVSYSGGLEPGFREGTKFKNMGYKRKGQVWFFDEDYATADNGVEFLAPFRVYKASKNPVD